MNPSLSFNTTLIRSARAIQPNVHFGYPPGVSLTDFVTDDMKALIHPHWSKFPPVNPMWHYLLGTIYIFLGVVSLCGNGIVISLFTKTKGLRSTANMFVVNLAFSDFCMMISQFPMFVHNSFNGGIWLFGPAACELYACLGGVFGATSICTMAVIAYDRYNVIVKGMAGTKMTSKRAATLIACCWIYATGWSITPYFGFGRYIPEGILDSCSFDYLTRDEQTKAFVLCLFIFLYCIPLTFITCCYYFIVKTIFFHEKTLRDQAKKMNVTSLRSNADSNAASAEIKIAKVALCNIALWAAMWTPYAAIVLKGIFGDQSTITPLVTILPSLITKSASICNPIVYAISHPKFRLALQEKYPWFCINEPVKSDNESICSTKTGVSSSSTTEST
ncbi:compound eye opsin BCRH2-like [Daphnia pulex]|uniref:compound eye opsin BCRH2-like n=1 Tax=Daphnia pulex TaxID=6669 RepID=UPI001EE025E1|nr:compound eye opsin BCRH2-like [Daphnia pulex]